MSLHHLGTTSQPPCPFCGAMATRQQAGNYRSWICGSHGVPLAANYWRDIEQSADCYGAQWGEGA